MMSCVFHVIAPMCVQKVCDTNWATCNTDDEIYAGLKQL